MLSAALHAVIASSLTTSAGSRGGVVVSLWTRDADGGQAAGAAAALLSTVL